MGKQFLKDSLLWGFILWLIGYALGIALFTIVPQNMLGWVISPIGIIITILVLSKKIKSESIKYYLGIAIVWTLIAIIFDYFFLVKLFNSADYYKLDVYVYYITTLVLPLLMGWYKIKHQKQIS